MPARSIGTGTLSFGMVFIPIRTYAAGESAAALVQPAPRQVQVAPQAAVRLPEGRRDRAPRPDGEGYEFSKEQYVTFTDDELTAMAEEAQKAIEITEFDPA